MANEKLQIRTLTVTFVVLIVSVLLTVTAEATPISITTAGQEFTIYWQYKVNDTLTLDAKGIFIVTTLDSTSAVLDLTISNSTVLPSGVANAGLESFGFNMDPDATGVAVSNYADPANTDWTADIQQKFPSFQTIDVCVWTGGCAGGTQGGTLPAGASDRLVLALTGSFGSTPQVTFYDDFPVKFQTGIGSYEFAGSSSPPIPEPETLLLAGTGLIGLAGVRRFRKN